MTARDNETTTLRDERMKLRVEVRKIILQERDCNATQIDRAATQVLR